MTDGEGFLVILLLMAFYFLPAIIAALVKNRQTAAIFALNSLLGWTLIGWCVALVWAFVQPQQQRN